MVNTGFTLVQLSMLQGIIASPSSGSGPGKPRGSPKTGARNNQLGMGGLDKVEPKQRLQRDPAPGLMPESLRGAAG